MFKKFFKRNQRLLAVLFVVVCMQFIEAALLQVKYNLFTGGFLQPYSYTDVLDQIKFISISAIFDLYFFTFIAVIWYTISKHLNRFSIITTFYYIVLSLALSSIWLVAKYKLLSYFNDTINFTIIKNLSGGSLREALLYVSNEIIFGIVIILLCSGFIYLVIRQLSKSPLAKKLTMENTYPKRLYQILGSLTIIIIVISYVTTDISSLRYGLQKKLSYNITSTFLNYLTDWDSDGYGVFRYPKDPELLNAHVYPGAYDIPENGIDEDGFFGDAQRIKQNDDPLKNIPLKAEKHIVLIVLESARYSLLDTKIHDQYVAPNIRTVAVQGSSAPFAYSHTGYTTSALKAIFNRSLVTDPKLIPLVDFLLNRGYNLSVFSGQDESFGDIAKNTGMDKAAFYFDARTAIDDRVYASKESGSLRLSEERVIEEFSHQVENIDFSQPQFFYINIQAAHFPYSHQHMKQTFNRKLIPRSKITPDNKQWLIETYWNAIASADWAVGEVISLLRRQGVYDNTLLVIVGDHGESLFDDGFLGHGHAINDYQTQIPLVTNDPEIKINRAIGQTDIAELIIHSALKIPGSPDKKSKPVFQLVGNISNPILIAHVGNKGTRTLLDLRSRRVFFSDKGEWIEYSMLSNDIKYKSRVEALIKDWDDLRWKKHQNRLSH